MHCALLILPFLVIIWLAIRSVEMLPAALRRRGKKSYMGFQAKSPVSGRIPEDARLFRLAAQRGGRLTVSDVVIETGLSISAAEKLLNDLCDGIRVRMEIGESGNIFYEFPEIRGESDFSGR